MSNHFKFNGDLKICRGFFRSALAPTQDSAAARLVLGGFEDINNGEEMYWDTEAEEVVDHNTELRGASYSGDGGVVRLLLGLENVDINSEDAHATIVSSTRRPRGDS